MYTMLSIYTHTITLYSDISLLFIVYTNYYNIYKSILVKNVIIFSTKLYNTSDFCLKVTFII